MTFFTAITLGLLALPCSISASPIDNPSIMAINGTQLANITLYGQYAAAAYYDNNIISAAPVPISCAKRNCDLVQQAGATAVLSFIK